MEGPVMLAMRLILATAICVQGQGAIARAGEVLADAPPNAPAGLTQPEKAKEKWAPLFNGRDLTGWYTFLQKHGKDRDPDHVITIEENAIHIYKNAPEASQVVMGYIGTQKEYGNYHLRFQYRWGIKKFEPRFKLKRDAGLYYHLNGPDAVWPRGLQFQIQQTDVGDLLTLYGFELDTWIDPKTRSDAQATFGEPEQGGQERVLGGKAIGYQKRLPGEIEVEGWNTIEVIAKGDTTVHKLNGHLVNRGKNIRFTDPEKPGNSTPVTRGRIALEIEAAEIYFRNVEIRELD
jgi:Domain of Unknown Function (DUF1080)